MAKQFKHIRARNLFVTNHTGSSIDSDARCAHGQGAAFIALFGNRMTPGSREERIDTLIPRCVLAELIGCIQAQIFHEEGEEALAAFLTEITGHKATFTAQLATMRARERDCCEAGYTTHGREHTCGRNGTQR